MRRQPRPVDVFDAGVGAQPFGDITGVVDVRLHPERQRLDALSEQEAECGGEHGADVAQLLGAQAGEEGVLAEVAGPVEAAVVCTGSSNSGKLVACQWKRPDSTTTPPMVVPCPPRNLVAECMTMSAPHSIGR